MRKFLTVVFFALLAHIGFASHSWGGEFPLEEALVPKCEISGTVTFQEKLLMENSVSLLLPIILFQYQNKAQSLWYSHIHGQYEPEKKTGFFGMGIGIRAIVSDDWFVGGYCLMNHKMNLNNTRYFQVLNSGLEWVSVPYQIGFGTYVPLNTQYSISSMDLVGSWVIAPSWKLSAGIYAYQEEKGAAQLTRKGVMAGLAYDINPYFTLVLKGIYSEAQAYVIARLNINIGNFEPAREPIIEEMLRMLPSVWYSTGS
jgi:hypothetical protein